MSDMDKQRLIGFQGLVFFIVAAAFTTMYITQPVLPVLRQEFGVDEAHASFTISAVVLGMALSNLPFGILADRLSIRPIVMTGGFLITVCGLVCATTYNFSLLVAARFVQGLLIPSLTTCIAAYIARVLPVERLNVVMGAYVSATVAGGLSGRLLGGWIHPPLHWRYAFVTASVILFTATCCAALYLPPDERRKSETADTTSYLELLRRPDLLRIYSVSFGSFFVFSSTFNYMPFYLAGPPFYASTQTITMLYLSYVVGIIISPLAGAVSNRLGNGRSMTVGAVVFALAIGVSFINSLWAVAISLTLVCAGFFTMHASAAGALNRKLTSGRGHANSLYVLFYYLGGYVGITLSGHAYVAAGWHGVATLGLAILTVPAAAGLVEARRNG